MLKPGPKLTRLSRMRALPTTRQCESVNIWSPRLHINPAPLPHQRNLTPVK